MSFSLLFKKWPLLIFIITVSRTIRKPDSSLIRSFLQFSFRYECPLSAAPPVGRVERAPAPFELVAFSLPKRLPRPHKVLAVQLLPGDRSVQLNLITTRHRCVSNAAFALLGDDACKHLPAQVATCHVQVGASGQERGDGRQTKRRQVEEQRSNVVVKRLQAGRVPLSRSTRARRRAAAAPDAVVVLEQRGPVDMTVAHFRHSIREAAHIVPVSASGARPTALREPNHKVRLHWRCLC